MWLDPYVQCYNDATLPTDNSLSVFLNGPTSRRQILEFNHRCLSVQYLREAGFKGWIYVPEPRGEEDPGDFTEKEYIYHWESSRRFAATCNSFWVPRDSGEMLGLNTNFEWGLNVGQLLYGQTNQMIFIGWPVGAERMGLPEHYSTKAHRRAYHDQKEMCQRIALELSLNEVET
jgi:hypothetical protein